MAGQNALVRIALIGLAATNVMTTDTASVMMEAGEMLFHLEHDRAGRVRVRASALGLQSLELAPAPVSARSYRP